MKVPWTARTSKQSILKETSPGCSFEGLMLRLKLQYFRHLMLRADSFENTLMLGKIEGRRRRGRQRMRWLDGITDLMDGLVGSPCSPRDSQESSSTPQFKSISSSALSFLHSPISFSSVQFSCSVMSDSLRPHESQHARPPCPSPTPRVHPESRPLSQ